MTCPKLLRLVSLIFFIKNASCSNILIACSVPSPSHQIWNYAFAEGLIAKGHNVTIAGPDADMHKKSEKYHPIVFEDVAKNLLATNEIDIQGSPSQSLFQLMSIFNKYIYGSCKLLYLTKGFQEILNLSENFKFDLIIVDMTLGPCLYPLIQKFNYPPTIGITAFLLPPFLSNAFGNYLPPSYLPYYHLSYPQDMTFFQRVENFLITNIDILLFREVYDKNQLQKLADDAFGDGVASLSDLERHVSLLLCNINPAFHYPQPVTPNIIPVGGLHARPPKKLPQDLQEIMDKATNGVILMSLGTNIRSDKLEESKRNDILTAFSKLKETVIWKFETDFDNLPPNVIMRKFLPQNDILGHPNTRLFITHGGGLSTLEAAYHGVPILGIPFFADQHMLANAMVQKKLGLKLEYPQITSETMLNALNELLRTKEYSTRIREISRRMKDTISTPLETAVFWAEYAMRHNGTQFLSPKSRVLPLFVSSSLDVISCLVLLLVIVIYTLFTIIRFLYRLISTTEKLKKN